MSLKLEPMTQKTFDEIYENSIHEYAHEHIKSGDWEAEGAIERARSDFEKLLPYGLATENQDLFSVIYLNEIIGYCWLHFEGIKKKTKCFIYDVHIFDSYRGQGLGEKTMLCIEDYCQKRNINRIGLHVFGHNERAVSLYNKLGFQTTNYRMEKVIGNDSH